MMIRRSTLFPCSLKFVWKWYLASLLLLSAGASAALAQGFGSLQGSVLDTSGAAIPEATVTATQLSTGHAYVVSSNGDGRYVFPQLQPSQYTLQVSSPNFATYMQNGITLLADQALAVNVTLTVGATTDLVTVNANALQVDTTTGTLSHVIDRDQVVDLPLNGRNAADLTTLVPGAVTGPSDDADQGVTKTFPVVAPTSINGARVYQTNYMLDGANNVDEYTNVNGPFPFPDALQEFSIQTSNYNAEYGQNAGGVVNIVIKSGQEKFHGALFEFLRNRVFNAASPFGYTQASQNSLPVKTVDPLKRNQFGGTISGPVDAGFFKLPNTFFMYGYQRSMLRNVTPSNAFVITDAERAGDFSALLTVNANNPIGATESIKDPTTGKKYANNYVDPKNFDPASVALISHLPRATGNGQIFYGVPLKEDFEEHVVRVDHSFSAKDQMFLHYFNDTFNHAAYLNPSNLLTYNDGSQIQYHSALVSETHVFTSKLLNTLIANYLNETSNRLPPSNSLGVTDFGVNIWQPSVKALDKFKVKGYFTYGDNAWAAFQRNSYNFSDDVHWVHGNHNVSFGARLGISKIDNGGQYQEPGKFTFNKRAGDGIASLMLGSITTFVQGAGTYSALRNTFPGFYIQDSWKVNRRLSLNYGVRYEPYLPWKERDQRIEVFNAAAYAAGQVSTVYPNAAKGIFFTGDSGVAPQGYNASYTHFMPRFGFAWDVFGDGKTALRGGSGIFYDSRTPGIYSTNAAQVTPFGVSVQYTNPAGKFSNPYAGTTNPFPRATKLSKTETFPQPIQVFTYDADSRFPAPVTYQWNLTLERALTKNMNSMISYVGSKSSHLLTYLEQNPATPNTSGSDGPRRYAEYSTITNLNDGGNSNYHSLQLSLQQRLANGLTVTANYTWSKAMDTLPYQYGDQLSYVYPVNYPNFRSLDIGLSNFDRRHVFSGSYVWRLPKWTTAALPVRILLDGWQTTGIVKIQSGDALTVTSSADASGSAITQDRAQYNGSAAYAGGSCASSSGPCRRWLNSSSFAQPAYGSFGNVRKGQFVGPGYVNWDGGLFREFPIYRETNLLFRAEYFNVLNHTNLNDPVTDVNATGFGNVISNGSRTPRIAQLSLKYRF